VHNAYDLLISVLMNLLPVSCCFENMRIARPKDIVKMDKIEKKLEELTHRHTNKGIQD
jgi:hypothetical protein